MSAAVPRLAGLAEGLGPAVSQLLSRRPPAEYPGSPAALQKNPQANRKNSSILLTMALQMKRMRATFGGLTIEPGVWGCRPLLNRARPLCVRLSRLKRLCRRISLHPRPYPGFLFAP